MQLTKKERLARRHLRVRKKVFGTAERPRLCVRKSLKHLYASVVDDTPDAGCRTIVTYTTASKETAGKHKANAASATELGGAIGADLKARGITSIVFDRGGYRYHGVVKALAEAIRAAGINF
jgi:large subunit ribosomal protein L18